MMRDLTAAAPRPELQMRDLAAAAPRPELQTRDLAAHVGVYCHTTQGIYYCDPNVEQGIFYSDPDLDLWSHWAASAESGFEPPYAFELGLSHRPPPGLEPPGLEPPLEPSLGLGMADLQR